VSKLALFRWQDMTKDIEKAWRGVEDKAFADQVTFEAEAVALFAKDPKKARDMLTKHSVDMANQAVAAYWKLADELWGRYAANF